MREFSRSATNTRPPRSTAMLCGRLNWPGPVPGSPQDASSSPLRGKAVHAGVAVAVRDEHLAAARDRDVGHHIERAGRVQDRRFADPEAGLGRPRGVAQRHQELAVGRELAHGVVEVVGAPDMVVPVDEDAVRARENALAPGIQEAAVLVEHDHRMGAAIEDVDPVLGIDGDARDLDERPALGQLLPAFQDLVLKPVGTDRHDVLLSLMVGPCESSRRARCGQASTTRPLAQRLHRRRLGLCA